MSLLDLAEADNAIILEDVDTGFGRSMEYQAPGSETWVTLKGQFIRRGTRISEATGLPVAGDEASVTIRISTFQTLVGAGLYPLKDGKFRVTDVTGVQKIFRIPADGLQPDRTAGRMTVTGLKEVAS